MPSLNSERRLAELWGELVASFRAESRSSLSRRATPEDLEDLAAEMALALVDAFRRGAFEGLPTPDDEKRVGRAVGARTARDVQRRALARKRQRVDVDISEAADWLRGEDAEKLRSELWLRELSRLASGMSGEILDALLSGESQARGDTLGLRGFAKSRGVSFRRAHSAFRELRELVERTR